MPVEFLTDDEAAAYGRFAGPPAQADLERVFFLDDEDRALVGRRRGEHMKLGFALQEVDRLGRNLLEGLIVLNDLFQRGVGVKVLEGIAAGEHTERSLILDLALALAEDRRRDITRKTKNGLEAARKRGRVGGRRPVVDDDKRAAILARRERGESIRTIAAGVKVSVGVVHKTLAVTEGNPADQPPTP